MTDYLAIARAHARRETSEVSEKSPANDSPRDLSSHLSLVSQPAERTKTSPADPRPDLAEDSQLWIRLLRNSMLVDGTDPYGLHGLLLGLRCYGAQLIDASGSLRLTRGEISEETYADWRRDLLPHRESLTRLLAELDHEGDRP